MHEVQRSELWGTSIVLVLIVSIGVDARTASKAPAPSPPRKSIAERCKGRFDSCGAHERDLMFVPKTWSFQLGQSKAT